MSRHGVDVGRLPASRQPARALPVAVDLVTITSRPPVPTASALHAATASSPDTVSADRCSMPAGSKCPLKPLDRPLHLRPVGPGDE